MEKAGAELVKQIGEERRRYIEDFLRDNHDLPRRLATSEVTTVLDLEDDVLTLTVGSTREAISFTPDGELYLRTDPETNKLIGAELHYFSEHVRNHTAVLRVILDFMT